MDFSNPGHDLVDQILRTEELALRPSRPPRYERENRALVDLLSAMEQSSQVIYQKVVDAALDLTGADSAGISILESDGGKNVFRWHATAGAFSPFVWNTMPREFSPCGTVLDRNALQLMAEPGRYFPDIAKVSPPIVEVLLVPFYRGDTPIGTVWVISHGESKRFDAEDARVVESISRFAGVAVRTLKSVEHLAAANRLLIVRDAEREESVAAMQKAREEAEAASREKDRFLAILSHDLRTPLTPALMTATVMQQDETLPAAIREDAGVIRRNIEIETRLIDDLLDVSRISAGKVELRVEMIALHRVVGECAGMCRAGADKKGVRLDVEFGASHDTVNGDPARLRQIVSNLLSNAVKFTPGGGCVTVLTSDVPGGIKLSVRDTGVGIHAETLPRVFDPFEQGSRAVTRQFQGLGLGLAIAKGFVDAHGGRIALESDGIGRGTTVTVSLPTVAGKETVMPDAQSPPIENGPVPEFSILLVEDHEDSLKVMSHLLRRLRHRVETAKTVEAALEVADRQDFDLLISDVGLPDGSGLDLMRLLRAKRDIHGIALTGYGGAEDIAAAFKAGFALHLTKPIRFEELESAVQRMAASKRKAAASPI